MRLIAVDDELVMLFAYRHMLEPEFDLVTVKDIDIALERLGEEHFDLALCDFVLQDAEGRDGLWLLSHIRESHPEMKRVLITGLERDQFEAALEVGLLHAYVQKPITGPDLRARLAEVMAQRHD